MKLCRCGGFYRRGTCNFHTNSWIHKLGLLRFQNNFVDEEDLIDDISSTTSTTIPEDKMTDYDSN